MITTDALSLALEPDVRAAQCGDPAAFARLVDASRNAVCSVTLAIVRDVARSEDVAQEVYVAAWKGLGKLRSTTSFLPWLRQLARNHANQAIRSAIRHRRRHAPWTDDAELQADPETSAPALLVAHEEEAALTWALEALPDETREVVMLFYREGQSAKQVGELLGMTEPAVKKRLERARDALRAAAFERLGEIARKTAPTAGFTLAVTAAIAVGAPGTAAAATGVAKSSLGSPLAKLLAVLGGAFVGGAFAVVAILRGSRVHLHAARDEEERRGIRRLTALNLGVLFTAIALGFALPGPRWVSMLPYVGYVVVILASYLVWMPRVVARRLAAERSEDPTAAERQRRARRRAYLGTGLGCAFAVAAMMYELLR